MKMPRDTRGTRKVEEEYRRHFPCEKKMATTKTTKPAKRVASTAGASLDSAKTPRGFKNDGPVPAYWKTPVKPAKKAHARY